MRAPVRTLLSSWPLAAALASAGMLAVAHGFQTFGGLAPCALCYRQREVYWLALAIGLASAAMRRWRPDRRMRRAVCGLLAAVFLFGAGLAFYHAGVEWHWWPGPTSCSAGALGIDPGAMAAMMKGAAVRAPACDKAAWVWLGLSMAGWNALASLGLAGVSAAAAMRGAGDD